MNSDVIDTSYIDEYMPQKVSYRTGGYKPRPVIGQNRSFDSHNTSADKDSQRPIIYESDNGNDVSAVTISSVQKPPASDEEKPKKGKTKKKKEKKRKEDTSLPEAANQDGGSVDTTEKSPSCSDVSHSRPAHRPPSPHKHSNSQYQYPTRTSTMKSNANPYTDSHTAAPANWTAKRRPPYQYPTQRRPELQSNHRQRPYGYPTSHHAAYYSPKTDSYS